MISAVGVTLQFGKRKLFENVNITFTPGNCYGIIGANGSGKSTFLKLLSGELDSTAGNVTIAPGKRLSILKQDQFAFDEYEVLETAIMGHKRLYEVMKEKDAIYLNPDFSEADGMRASELEAEFTELNGWNATTDAEKLLIELGIPLELHTQKMKQLEAGKKVRVLLAQALFGDPDILLLDEPTNQLDVETSMWLEEFLYNFANTAIVVSHDRHFLDKVCTHVADIDYGRVQLFPGNYTFWLESSRLATRQRSEQNKKVEDRRKELQDFIARFSANASKSKQATSRKKLLEKLTIDDIKPSSRKYPYVGFSFEKDAGNDILRVEGLAKSTEGELIFKGLNFDLNKGDKVAFIGRYDLARTVLFDIVMGENRQDSGQFKWGASTVQAYFPKENSKYFKSDLNLIDWLRQFSTEKDETFIRGFLGKMLFSGDETLKRVNVLSGGEKVRLMLSKMMLTGANMLVMDEPTNHLDLESIIALNEGLEKFRGTLMFSSQDHQFIQTIANRVIEITPHGYIDRMGTTFDEYMQDERIKAQREALYQAVPTA